MKLKDLLKLTHELANKVAQMKMNVEFCPDCKGKEISQAEHMKKHLDEAMKIKEELPFTLVRNLGHLKITPKITMTIEDDLVKAKLIETEIY